MINNYNTSLRARPIEETLVYARQYAEKYGITRVTDTTHLDYIGLPVFASIRPDAAFGSLCVNGGKGLDPREAKVGAYMEAIEFALAEPNRAKLKVHQLSVGQVLDSAEREDAILDFCPKLGSKISPDQKIECVEADDLYSGQKYMVPAELVFMPYEIGARGTCFFGASTNGLSSGNTLTEASIHGILEVMERDIISFETIRDAAVLVDPASYPENVMRAKEKIEKAGLELYLRYSNNHFGIPFFYACLIDAFSEHPMFINGGYGCHTDKKIAAMRAVSEAVQSRLTVIHGGRDDLLADFERFERYTEEEKKRYFHQHAAFVRLKRQTISFDDIGQPAWEFDSLEQYQEKLLQLLKAHGVKYVLRVAYTKPDEPLQVVRIIIPTLEFLTKTNSRIGKRLMLFAQGLRK